MDQPRMTTHTPAQEETAHGAEQDSSEDRFYAQLSRGASSLMLRPSSSPEPLGHSDACNEPQELGKAKEASKEEEEEDTDVDELRQSPRHDEVDKAKENEEEEAGRGDTEEAKRKVDQMRRDEALARQLQIQFLREVAGADPELLHQLNVLVQQEASAALNESSPVVLDHASDAAELVECAICCEEKKLQEIYTYYQCGHRYCVECLQEYYATHILEGDVKLRCPYPGCSTAVLPVQVAAVVTDSQVLHKYKQFAWYDEVKSNPNTRWCTKPGCETVLVRPDSGEPKVVCSGCGTVTCFLCGDEWHEGASCEDNRKRKIEAGLADTTVEDYVKQQKVNVRICPRCAVPIEKNKGCNTMTCSFCGCSFCWLCGQVMTPHHFSQKGPCKGKDGEAKWLKALVYTILAGMIVTLPVWAGPAYVVYKVKQHKRKRLARAVEAAEAAASAPAQNS